MSDPSQSAYDATSPVLRRERYNHLHDTAERTVILIGSTITAILAIRFLLALLGANQDNAFVSLIDSVTKPLVAPFYSLFAYDHPHLAEVSFQGYTLIAMGIYSLITAWVSRLATITRY